MLWRILSYFWNVFTGAVCVLFFFILNRTEVKGRKNLPFKRNVLLLSNHQSMIDSFLISSVCYFPIGIWRPSLIPWHTAARENFFFHPFLALASHLWQCIPVGEGRKDPEALRRAVEILPRGVMMIFPEGTRTRTGEIGKGKPGVGKLIFDTKADVVPIRIFGMRKLLPIGCYLPRIFCRVKVVIGKPLDYGGFWEKKFSKKLAEAIVEKAIIAIKDLRDC